MSDDKDSERLRNLLIFKVWATDKELEEMSPWLIVVLIVVVIMLLAVSYGVSH